MQPAGRGDRPIGMKAEYVTHPRTAARPLACAAAALACVLAVVSGPAVAGCAGSPAGTGSPVPAPAILRLTVIGSRAAKANGDAAPPRHNAPLQTFDALEPPFGAAAQVSVSVSSAVQNRSI